MNELIKVQRLKLIAIILLYIFLLLSISLSVYEDWHLLYKYDYKPESYNYVCYVKPSTAYSGYYDHTKSEQLIAKEFGVKYWLLYKDLDNNTPGRSNAMFHIVTIDIDCKNVYNDKFEYEKALAHELTHIKYQTVNETYTTYMAIVTLLESKNNYLKYIGVKYANDVLLGGYYGTNYDCSNLLANYCKIKGIQIYCY